MTKPRYTYDPPPEVLDPVVREWLARQHTRIYDLWPEDLSARLEALEANWPFVGGTWPIVDYASVNFNFTAQDLSTTAFIGRIGTLGGSDWTTSVSDYDSFISPLTPTPVYGIRKIANNGQGLFAAIGADGTNGSGIYSTSDGTTWIRQANPWPITSNYVTSFIWDANGSRWVAAMPHPNPTVTGQGTYIRASTDLVTWTTLYETTSGQVYDIIATDGAGTFLVGCRNLGFSNQDQFLYSTDGGENWAESSGSVLFYGCSTRASGIPSWVHDRWYFSSSCASLNMCAVGGDFTNPSAWSIITFSNSVFHNVGEVVPGFDGVGGKVYTFLKDIGGTKTFWRGTNGVNFSSISVPANLESGWPSPQSSYRPYAYDSALGWIMVNGGDIIKSVDAATWTASANDGDFSQLANVAVGLAPL